MKLVFFDENFWLENEARIAQLVKLADGKHGVFRTLMEVEYSQDDLTYAVDFDCTPKPLVDVCNNLATSDTTPKSIVISFKE